MKKRVSPVKLTRFHFFRKRRAGDSVHFARPVQASAFLPLRRPLWQNFRGFPFRVDGTIKEERHSGNSFPDQNTQLLIWLNK